MTHMEWWPNEVNQRLALRGHLQRHLRIHSGVKPHTCKDCGESFVTGNNYIYKVCRLSTAICFQALRRTWRLFSVTSVVHFSGFNSRKV